MSYAIAIHGGAGTLPRTADGSHEREVTLALERALRRGLAILEAGGPALAAVEQAVMALEDDALFNAGRGAVFNAAGGHELDASLMDGHTLRCGAVAAVRTVKNPILLARAVMERTPHVLLVGEGAEAFAGEVGAERVKTDYFDTPRRFDEWQKARQSKGTVGAVAVDREGHTAAATSTGGTTHKKVGRVGDSALIGAGTYADARCAVSGTGIGEEFIRHNVAHTVCMLTEVGRMTLAEAADHMVRERLKPGDGGVIAVSQSGDIAMPFNTEGMYRGAATSRGRFEVALWK